MPLKKYRRTTKGNWYLRGTVQGNHVHESTGTSVAAQAEAIRIRRESELLERRAFGPAATYTFAEGALRYMETGRETRFLAPILRYFGADMLMSEIDNAAIAKAAEAIYPGRKPATINRQLITPIAAIVNMAAEENLTPFRKFRKRKENNQRTRWLTPEEAERLIENVLASHPHLAPAIGFNLGGGMRVGEAVRQEVSKFYPLSGEAFIPKTKNGHPRMVLLPARAMRLIMARPLPDTGPILLTPSGNPYTQYENQGSDYRAAFSTCVKAAELDPKEVTPHVLRHTWATWFYSMTKDFGGLLDIGGWQNANMANRYRKIAPADLADRLRAHGWDFTRIGRDAAEDLRNEGARQLRAV